MSKHLSRDGADGTSQVLKDKSFHETLILRFLCVKILLTETVSSVVPRVSCSLYRFPSDVHPGSDTEESL